MLILARALQGAAGGILPLSIGIVRDELPKEKIGVTVGLLSAIFGVGAGYGFVAAGPIVENLSWHWLFWLPLVLVMIALLGVVLGMKESPVFTPGRLDVVGASILTVALVSLLREGDVAAVRSRTTDGPPSDIPNAVFGRPVRLERRGRRDPFTAITSNHMTDQLTARLIVLRVRDANPDHVAANAQGKLLPVWRHHAVFTDSSRPMLSRKG